ncbi:MAG: DASS family sodium-coupled anion symporter [Pirellulales bacterium]
MTPKNNSSKPLKSSADATSLQIQQLGRIGGPVAALGVYLLLVALAKDLPHPARVTATVGTLMAVWWVTEALPLAVTSLLPLSLFPLAGVLKLDEIAAPYADKNIFLFLGGFLIALAVERWNLHRRIALLTILAVGTRPDRLVGGVMLATAGLSMWISNTATAAMMLPIGISLATLLGEQLGRVVAAESGGRTNAEQATKSFATCLMLGIAYSASIGGLGTLIGTPTNVALAGFASKNGLTIGFGTWMIAMVPLVLVFEWIVWLVLTKWLFRIQVADLPGGRELIRSELRVLGPISRGEWVVMCVFALTALAWVVRDPLVHWAWLTTRIPMVGRLDDPIIAMLGATLLFILPVDAPRGIYAMDWETASKIPWGVLLLFGGGFAFSTAMMKSGLTEWLGRQIALLGDLPAPLIILATITIVIFTTEITSNTPTILAFLPILFSVAKGLNIPPLELMAPATIAASCAFMLPVGTPPNAIVFATGKVTIAQMVRAGWVVNLIGIGLIFAAVYVMRALGIVL